MKIGRDRSVAVLLLLASAFGVISLQGCATLKARHAVPTDQIYNARIPDMPNVRVVLDIMNANASIIKLEEIGAREMPVAVPEPAQVVMLALSGGGAGGAFAAGLLCGWTEAGDRPEFHVVTGISTGALAAPAAFLGSRYDSALKKLCTTHSDKDIAREKDPILILFGASDSLMDTKPLARVLAEYITMDMMKAIADEHDRGRRLYVGTS